MSINTLKKTDLSLFIISIVITILVIAKVVLIPLAISFFLAYLFYPLAWKIEKWGVHRGISIFIVLFISIIIFAGIVLLISVKLSNMTLDVSHIKEQINNAIDSATGTLEEKTGLNSSIIDSYGMQAVSSVLSSWEAQAGSIISSTTTILFQIGILPVFTFFLLYYRSKTASFIFRLAGKSKRATTLNILREVSSIATKYLTGQFYVILILAVLNTIGLSIIGVPNALIFGSMTAVMNLIPFLGMFSAVVITMFYVVFTVADPFNMVLYVLLMYIGIQFLENNLITPNIVGNNIKINPFAIIVGLLIANMIWGIAGMLIVIPFLAMLKIIMRNIDDLKPFAYLISDRKVSGKKTNSAWWHKLLSVFKKQ